MKAFTLLVAMSLVSGFVMAKNGGGSGDQIQTKELYDADGFVAATVITLSAGCTLTKVPAQGGDAESYIKTCEE
jgi:hypothetical protein